MKDQANITRREALRRTVLLTVVSVGGGLAVACGKKEDAAKKQVSCTDTSSLAPADVEMRSVTLQYVDKATDPSKRCDNCQLYKAAPSPDACGACTLVKGPINPAGSCKAWAAKPPT